jgi:N-hydroxyarylamine O-acetyltransferase
VDISAYLKRINFSGSLDPSAENLPRLQVAHLLAVPFENLSIHEGEPIVLNDAALFEKIVQHRRGGFCYELNGLFAALLRELGFDVQMLSASVCNSEGKWGPDFDHMTLLVTLDERWLVDVGFGDSFVEPLRFDLRTDQTQGSRAYRIDEDADGYVLRQRIEDGEWRPQYRFTLEPHVFADYEEMCLYQQTSPESHFTKARICSRLTSDGRLTISGNRFITTKGNTRAERELSTDSEIAEALREHFGIVM